MVKIAIFGVGLMGGSLALCFKGKPDLYVVGHSTRQSSVQKYIERGVVDHATTSLREAAEDADFIFLCVPVGSLESYMKQLSEIKLKPGCIISDVGSTKASVNACARSLDLGEAIFIGGHPMAGSERSGVEAASLYLYENAFYVLTPNSSTPPEAVERLKELLIYTKANIVIVDAEEHDDIVGAISHLPHMIAVALTNQVRRYNETNALYSQLAAGGFRDITRIASSDPAVWRDILVNNRDVLLRLIDDWNTGIEEFARMLKAGDLEGIGEAFRTSGEFRNSLPERRKGVIHAIYECYVDVPDTPGVIGRIATELGNRHINLSNMQIIESREDVPGILRLSFRKQDDLDQAVIALGELQYSVHF
ncbi:prephenate dehydrogenase [Paenibacillus cellulosilyticus]|uniref:Prephenate dehydrogenase n=1 Tax=Paenibacillus cellulosilyticus TaxID=375489 RepID=A0A2V2YW03_9BACL|nr:prephenate dehydrogenase [Paenibacillus cellulosilyticus]PWW05536.1 prephenate dehydrogenase [Paenibacillus cellulosilyticus]QKS45427.1 prephenate dehydrogenase [Paenibacillus cellulosilyticus]